MARTTRRSTARRSKAALLKAKAASWSTDDVYRLLKAVNEETLARMEKQVKDVNEITLKRIEGKLNTASDWAAKAASFAQSIEWVCLNRLEPPILAIKTRVGALTKGSTTGSRGRARKGSGPRAKPRGRA